MATTVKVDAILKDIAQVRSNIQKQLDTINDLTIKVTETGLSEIETRINNLKHDHIVDLKIDDSSAIQALERIAGKLNSTFANTMNDLVSKDSVQNAQHMYEYVAKLLQDSAQLGKVFSTIDINSNGSLKIVKNVGEGFKTLSEEFKNLDTGDFDKTILSGFTKFTDKLVELEGKFSKNPLRVPLQPHYDESVKNIKSSISAFSANLIKEGVKIPVPIIVKIGKEFEEEIQKEIGAIPVRFKSSNTDELINEINSAIKSINANSGKNIEKVHVKVDLKSVQAELKNNLKVTLDSSDTENSLDQLIIKVLQFYEILKNSPKLKIEVDKSGIDEVSGDITNISSDLNIKDMSVLSSNVKSLSSTVSAFRKALVDMAQNSNNIKPETESEFDIKLIDLLTKLDVAINNLSESIKNGGSSISPENMKSLMAIFEKSAKNVANETKTRTVKKKALSSDEIETKAKSTAANKLAADRFNSQIDDLVSRIARRNELVTADGYTKVNKAYKSNSKNGNYEKYHGYSDKYIDKQRTDIEKSILKSKELDQKTQQKLLAILHERAGVESMITKEVAERANLENVNATQGIVAEKKKELTLLQNSLGAIDDDVKNKPYGASVKSDSDFEKTNIETKALVNKTVQMLSDAEAQLKSGVTSTANSLVEAANKNIEQIRAGVDANKAQLDKQRESFETTNEKSAKLSEL